MLGWPLDQSPVNTRVAIMYAQEGMMPPDPLSSPSLPSRTKAATALI